jgi:hypothetical protein
MSMMSGEIPSCCAVSFCRLPKSTFEDVSEPVDAVPNQPMRVPKKGKSDPVRANARPRAASRLQKRVRRCDGHQGEPCAESGATEDLQDFAGPKSHDEGYEQGGDEDSATRSGERFQWC